MTMAQARANQNLEAVATPPLRVLVADDSTVSRRVLLALIHTVAPNTEVVEARNGEEAIALLKTRAFDVCFVDVHMPGMTGIEAVAQVRAEGRNPLCAFMIEAVEEIWESKAREIDAYELLQKPVDETEIQIIFSNVERMREPSRVLVVDDSKASRLLIAKVMANSHFTIEVDSVDSGEFALATLKKQPYDAVFLDYDMPGIDGLETACLMQEFMPDVRVVMISASHNPAVERAARYFGAVHFLRKPFYGHEVDWAMHVALKLPRPSLMADPDRVPLPPLDSLTGLLLQAS